ncbi:MAG TPA: glycosyltransferase family 1 protein, partial [bacterium]|nr:glycosyltransferase family 1 protein [bacterium]
MSIAEKKKNMIFHTPLPLFEDPASASGLRPLKMIEAFKNIGYNVDVVSGYANERKTKIREILRRIEMGQKYDFCYCESSTMPTLLTEPNHLPVAPFLDFHFIKKLKDNSISTALFYRDIHWVFEQYKNATGFFKRFIATLFYRYDLLMYNRLFDVLFLPSEKMVESIPVKIKINKIFALPPGCDITNFDLKDIKKIENELTVVYAGGIIPPLYDLSPLFEAIKKNKKLRLFLICREEEFINTNTYYDISNVKNIEIIHGSGATIRKYFLNADIYAILWKPFSYLSFAYPYKLFEALSYGLPIITTKGTATSDFVENNNIGWTVDLDN